MDRRIDQLFHDKHTKQAVKFEDVFPGKIGDVDIFTYIVDRSLFRPRDIISFVNECFASTDNNSPTIGAKTVRTAEISYSRKRMRSIADEWRGVYGDLETSMRLLAKLDVRFTLNQVSDQLLEGLCIDMLAGDGTSSGRFTNECSVIANNTSPNYNHLRKCFLEIMYVVGAIGYRRYSGNPFEWSFKNEPILNYSVVNHETTFAVHPLLHRELNLRSDVTSLLT